MVIVLAGAGDGHPLFSSIVVLLPSVLTVLLQLRAALCLCVSLQSLLCLTCLSVPSDTLWPVFGLTGLLEHIPADLSLFWVALSLCQCLTLLCLCLSVLC